MNRLPALLETAKASGQLLDTTLENIEAVFRSAETPDWGRDSIEELVEGKHWTELNDRFFKNLAFGTGGIRGRTIGKVVTKAEQGAGGPLDRPEHAGVGSNMLNSANIRRAGMALGQHVLGHFPGITPKIVICHDMRHFSRQFAEEIAADMGARGIQAYLYPEERSTPQLSWSVRWLKAQAGIMITASHNPPHDNGFKAYFADGGQLVEPHASAVIKEFTKLSENPLPEPDIDPVPVITLGDEADQAYQDAVATLVLEPQVVKDMASSLSIVYTNIHGTGIKAIPKLLERFGFTYHLVPEQEIDDSRFPTVKSPNPENAEALQMGIDLAEKLGADIVIGTDPDDDRMGVVVRDGAGKMQLLTGNKIGSIMAYYRTERFFAQGILNDANKQRATLIKTIVTTDLQKKIAAGHGIKCIDTLTGFKYIGEKMLEYEQACGLEDYDVHPLAERRAAQLEKGTFFVFGGEESYGYSGADYVRDKDANAATVMFAEAAAWAKSRGQTLVDYLDDIYRKYGFFQEKLGTLTFEGAEGAAKIKRLLASLESDPPKEFLGVEVTRVDDYGKQDFHDADGKLLPKEGVLMFHLADGSRMATRASGTEPKIKFYFFTQAEVGDNLEATKAERIAFLDKWWAHIQQDAERRAASS